jgi:hypothetical protein
MGNRAVVTIEGSKVGVYLHWNGGEDSVTAFLRAAKDLEVRAPANGNESYFYARFTQIIGNFFGGTTSVGIDDLDNLDTDNGDNGTFVIGSELQILKREHVPKSQRVPMSAEDKARSEAIYQDVMRINKPIFVKA